MSRNDPEKVVSTGQVRDQGQWVWTGEYTLCTKSDQNKRFPFAKHKYLTFSF